MNDRPALGPPATTADALAAADAAAAGAAGPTPLGTATRDHGPPPGHDGPGTGGERSGPAADIGASMVVFLVALPLCVGVAVASGVPPERGLLTGIVGGLVVGLLPGSSLQVSGPAAGLTVLVASLVADHGLARLGPIVLGAGLVQVAMGLAGAGTWFRAVCPSVVQGMLAGIGLVLIAGQVFEVVGQPAPAHLTGKVAALPGLVGSAVAGPTGRAGLALATLALVSSALWGRLRGRLRHLPGPLVGVVAATVTAAALDLPVPTVEVASLATAVSPPGGALRSLLEPGVVVAAVTLALVASAESLFSAAAVDRLHDGPRTRYNAELVSQGVGNTICGLLGALPMTAVIVRSSVNVRAGARTRLSRFLHGVWLLALVAAVPGLIEVVPMAVLAALLLHAGARLLKVREVLALARRHPADAAVVALTAGAVVTTDLLVGTLVGMGAAVAKSAWELSRLSMTAEHGDDHVQVRLGGNATFLRLPRLLELLDRLPASRRVHLDLTRVRHLDRACHQAVEHWVAQRRRADCTVEVTMPSQA